ncbi:hypothetical protein FB45DRAFT_997782 [Roridomyces roridus]|uniref:Uncharacterized protein n=1 Tax=Roridomyces roridus TaxID=1738132 RepID=A0AAD7CKN3_9AGAR|nr:hypothetical protein FB45DRAFT_997782 [Roridomyces roridus]
METNRIKPSHSTPILPILLTLDHHHLSLLASIPHAQAGDDSHGRRSSETPQCFACERQGRWRASDGGQDTSAGLPAILGYPT